MTAHIYSATNIGFEGKLIEVECDASNGLPNLLIVGLGSKAIDEAKERVRSAIRNSGLEFPRKRITVNLAPANLPKNGAHFDLPIALALLSVSNQIPRKNLQHTLVVGELGLDGALRPVRGIIGHVQKALDNNMQAVILPYQNHSQAALVKGIKLIPATTLKEIILHLRGEKIINQNIETPKPLASSVTLPTLDDIYGQEQAKRALVIAASGHHNLLLSGPPGAGKTMLAKTLLSALPPLTDSEIIEVTKIHSLAGEVDENIVTSRPFRSPHHSASHISIIGGGQQAKPGEISLAHRGVLFLDELPEYNRLTIEALRQPLEDKTVHITRAQNRATYPADCMLVATQNPCPCGYANDTSKECICSSRQIVNYQKKISGPLLDRIDLSLTLSRVEHTKLFNEKSHSSNYYKRILQARKIQLERFGTTQKTNANLNNNELKQYAKIEQTARTLLDAAATKLDLSARSYFKVIKVARTIADLESSESISTSHISEALQYRYRPI